MTVNAVVLYKLVRTVYKHLNWCLPYLLKQHENPFDWQAKQTKLIANLLNTLTFKAVLVGGKGNRWCVEPAANLL